MVLCDFPSYSTVVNRNLTRISRSDTVIEFVVVAFSLCLVCLGDHNKHGEFRCHVELNTGFEILVSWFNTALR